MTQALDGLWDAWLSEPVEGLCMLRGRVVLEGAWLLVSGRGMPGGWLAGWSWDTRFLGAGEREAEDWRELRMTGVVLPSNVVKRVVERRG